MTTVGRIEFGSAKRGLPTYGDFPQARSDTALRAFHNALRILMNIDAADLKLTGEQRWEFTQNPHLFFIRCDDPTAEKLWALIQARQRERYRV